jgi:hypothetical protein
MIKKIVFATILALQFAAVCSVATADLPWPTCAPCPADNLSAQLR